ELLGELQVSFVIFFCLSSLEAFRQWHRLCAMLCRCEAALVAHPDLFRTFIRILHAHLKLVPEDFFEVELSKDNFLVPCLSAMFQNILVDSTLDPQLRDSACRLMRFLQKRFGIFALDLGGESHSKEKGEGGSCSRDG
ncbi:unnamed protein product, partial [Discosporangium mesarthrocarpum]